MKHKKIILCFVQYYLPGFRSGGPVRTVANFADHLGDEFDIRIVCCDRDLNDVKPYPNIKIDTWNAIGKTKVFYISVKKTNFFSIKKLLIETQYDILYLNSFFNFGFAILPLFIRYLGFVKKVPCIIGPRGEFSKSALDLKKVKKKFFMFFVKNIGLYKNLYWQASSELELLDIQREFGEVAKKITVARDLTPLSSISQKIIPNRREKEPLRIIFLSRISPMKNLDFLLKVLARVSTAIELSIFGPKENIIYWNSCKELIKKLPDHVKINIGEEVPHENVINIFSFHDLFVFPTLGEALGHIILESLSAGTPVLVSDRTSWVSDGLNGLEALPLSEAIWVEKIEYWSNLSNKQMTDYRKAALAYAEKTYQNNYRSITENKKLFYDVVKIK
jgi:glycosyltransferase involved in cell wall biosynthesis